jgi:hypothetical protein
MCVASRLTFTNKVEKCRFSHVGNKPDVVVDMNESNCGTAEVSARVQVIQITSHEWEECKPDRARQR